uniref:Serine/threonine protein phosphatase 2A regulatory subunit B' iota isoform n=1 Tax=Anthurium amnicola TaxID=1678845 RepID=A0A1D1YRP6_9ARAE
MGAPKRSPRCSPKKKPTSTLEHLFYLDSEATGHAHPTPNNGALPSRPGQSETDELLYIINYCAHVFTFTDPDECPSQQDFKRHKLSQLLSIARSSRGVPWPDRVLSPLVSMLAGNLFRPLPPPASSSCPPENSPDDAENPAMAFAPSWPHLHLAYDVLGAIVAGCSDPGALRAHLNRAFISGLLALFRSEDPRERERLKNVYHQIYARLAFHRRFMRKSMRDELLRFAFEGERHCGVGELLEIWGSIIDGFTVPLKEEHRVFLARVLVPLHRSRGVHLYHRQLAYCVCRFVEKEAELGEVVVKGMLRCWPSANYQKEVLLIGELEELVESTDGALLDKLALPLCTLIARSLSSCNSQVAERALVVWDNARFVRMASRSMDQVLPAVVEGIEKNIRSHWSQPIRQLTASVKNTLEEMEPRLYAECLQDFNRRESTAGEEEMMRKAKWDRLEMAATKEPFTRGPAMSLRRRQSNVPDSTLQN